MWVSSRLKFEAVLTYSQLGDNALKKEFGESTLCFFNS